MVDFVLNVDYCVEEIIYEYLSKVCFGYGFMMEECGIVDGMDKINWFIVDLLDGILNFLYG